MRKKSPKGERSLTPAGLKRAVGYVARAASSFAKSYPGDSEGRQPIHTVYGGAHLFRRDSARKLGDLALHSLERHAPDGRSFAEALQLRIPDWVGAPMEYAQTLHARVVRKLSHEPVEDLRIDFEDGYGHRPAAEEDAHAKAAAEEVAAGMESDSLPPFIGVRIKPLSKDLAGRSLRTLDLFLTALVRTATTVPAGFVVTLPKVVAADQVRALVSALGSLETSLGLRRGCLGVELMIETPQSVFDAKGLVALPALVAAARGRCRSVHFGTYDYTASHDITAAYQMPGHPASDFARQVMKIALAGSGVTAADSPTAVLPVELHRARDGEPPLTDVQLRANRESVHQAWRLHFGNVRYALERGFYSGWDLHPAQLPVRYAAVYSFFLEQLPDATLRLRNFVQQAAQATRVGAVFDDAATAQGLLNYFVRGIACGALNEAEVEATGLTTEQLQTRSFG